MKKQIMQQLLILKEQYGEALFSEHKRLLGLVKDYFPYAKHEHYLLRMALPLELYQQFKKLPVADYMKCRNEQIYQLESQKGMSHQWAEEAVDFWINLVKKELGNEAAFSQAHSLEEKLQEEAQPSEKGETVGMGSLMAILHKANCYYNGEGIAQNRREALKWYEKAAYMGSVEAMNYVGNIYHMGDGVAQNSQLALQWYEKAANLGSATAMNYIGNMYYEGRGVEKNDELASKWYNQAAAEGNYTAMFNLGYIYYERTLSKAQRSFEESLKAAQTGDTEAMYFVAYSYHWGMGAVQDFDQALKWYELLAGKGERTAMTWLAYMYFNGQGVEKSVAEAKNWCEKAMKIHKS